MQYIEAINYEKAKYKSVFLAGGITNCPDWQKVVTKGLAGLELTVYNPRRKSFDISRLAETEKQIIWEYEMLRKSDFLIFYFSEKTLNPITLFEYGAALERTNKICVCVHPNYLRCTDIEIQTQLRRPGLKIAYQFEDLISNLKQLLKL